MSERKAKLLQLASIAAEQELYKHNLTKEEIVLSRCFLIVLAHKNLLPVIENKDKKNKLISLISENINRKLPTLENLFTHYLIPILEKAGHTYIEVVVNKINSLNKSNLKDEFLFTMNYRFESQYAYEGGAAQPFELTEVMNFFLPKTDKATIYNPFAGIGSLGLNLKKTQNYLGEEIHHLTWALGLLNLTLHNVSKNVHFEQKNSIESWITERAAKYDFITCNPPLDLVIDRSYHDILLPQGTKSTTLGLIINTCFNKLTSEGRFVFLAPRNFLMSSGGKNKSLIRSFINNKNLETVIDLPNNILGTTAVALSLIVLTKKECKKTFLIDATTFAKKSYSKNKIIDSNKIIKILKTPKDSKFASQISKGQIIENNYNLSVNRYVFEPFDIDGLQKQQLNKLERFLIPIRNKKEDYKQTNCYLKTLEFKENKVLLSTPFAELPIYRDKKKLPVLEPRSILLDTRAGVGWYFKGAEKPIFYEPNRMTAFKVVEELANPEYVVLELKKSYIKKQLQRFTTGTVFKRITLRDFLQIEMVLPPLGIQEKNIYDYKYEQIRKETSVVQDLMTEYGVEVADKNSYLRHQIAGRVRNASGAIKSLKTIFNNAILGVYPEIANLKLDPKLNNTFADYLQLLERDLQSIQKSLKSTGDIISLSDLKFEEIDIIQFVDKYLNELKQRITNVFTIQFNKDQLFLEENQVQKVLLKGDRDALRKCFDNIIENAENHGFKNNASKSNKIIVELLYDTENDECQLDFSNTGTPFSEDFTHDTYIRSGSKGSGSHGDGTGGWFINQVIKAHNGKLNFTDETGSEGFGDDLATTIELTFPVKFIKK